jgi:iron complex outermembrane receptor protein
MFMLPPLPGAVSAQQAQSEHEVQTELLDTVTVTAERINEYAGQHPGHVVVLQHIDIEEHNILSVEEALNNMAGVDVQKSTGTGSRISIRGSSKIGGILVLLNGRPLNSSQYGGVELSSIPIDIVESITVFKPPVPVWLGAGASEGAICIVTRSSDNGDDGSGKNVTKIRAAAGSYGWVETAVSQRLETEKGAAMLAAEGTHLDGKRTNSDRDSGSMTFNWDRKLGDGDQTLEIGGRYYGAEYGSSGPTDNPTPDARQSYQKASLDGRLKGFWGEGGDYSLALYGDYIDLEDESQTGLTSTLENSRIGLKAENSWTDDVWSLRLNGIAEREDVDHTLSGKHDRETFGAGAQGDRIWDDLVLTLGLRGDQTTDFGFNPGFSSGVSYELTDGWSLKAGAGYSVNIPTFGQLYQPSHGTIDQARGNPDLNEEKIWSYDAGIKYEQPKKHSLQVSLFRADTADPIVYERGEDLIYRPLNDGRSWRHGVELTAKYIFGFGLNVDGDVVVQDSEIEDTGCELPYTPRFKAKLTLFHTLKDPGTRLETTLRYRSKQYSEAGNIEAESIDEYVTADLKVTQPFTIKSVAMEWFVNVENLFDVEYQVHYGYPDDGIRFLSGLNVTF